MTYVILTSDHSAVCKASSDVISEIGAVGWYNRDVTRNVAYRRQQKYASLKGSGEQSSPTTCVSRRSDAIQLCTGAVRGQENIPYACTSEIKA